MWDLLILNPMINTLLYIYDLLGDNFGLAIIVFTVLIRLLTLPLSLRQQHSMQKMQDLQKDPRFKKIQEKFKDDRQKQQEEQMKLYQEMGINPLAGCLPLIIQLPIIFGLYGAIIRALADSPVQLLELSKHIYSSIPTGLIPLNSQFLWMDLSQPERLFIPGLSFGIPVLTIIVVISTYFQTKLTTPATPGDGQSGAMGQVMGLYMPLFLGYFAYTLASGLALYFVISNLLQIAQYAATGRVEWRNLLPGAKPSSGK